MREPNLSSLGLLSAMILLLLGGGLGCPGPTIVDDDDDSTGDDDDSTGEDADGDGWSSPSDCNDEDPAINPEAREACDEIDNDCDGRVDENWDLDVDGFLDQDAWPCRDLPGERDCNDDDGRVYPGADEFCDDADSDCDGVIPEDEQDLDADGWSECMGDCQPLNDDFHPDAIEEHDLVDNNCDGAADEGFVPAGVLRVVEFLGNPGASDEQAGEFVEVLNVWAGGPVPPGAPDVAAGSINLKGLWIYGGARDEAAWRNLEDMVLAPGERAVFAGSLDASTNGGIEADGAFHPGYSIGNAFGGVVLGLGETVLFEFSWTTPIFEEGVALGMHPDWEATADPYLPGAWCAQTSSFGPSAELGTPGQPNDACGGPSDGDGDGILRLVDCDDSDPLTYPTATEVCDGRDNDCNGRVDEDFDSDEDGFASSEYPECAGLPLPDCDDTNPFLSPGRVERNDGQDTDCNGLVDDVGPDGDGDGVLAIEGDCNDDDPSIYLGQTEVENGLDDDCNGLVDEIGLAPGDVLITELMLDSLTMSDGDGEWFELHNPGPTPIDMSGWVLSDGGLERAVLPVGTIIQAGGFLVIGHDTGTPAAADIATPDFQFSEYADRLSLWAGRTLIHRVDWNTDWAVSTGASLALSWDRLGFDSGMHSVLWCMAEKEEGELDEWGTPGAPNAICVLEDDLDGDGFTVDEGDCNDTSAEQFPGYEGEYCDGLDNDCDGLIDEETDEDGDGYSRCADVPWFDCDDGDESIYWGAEEQLGELDHDCNGVPADVAGLDQDGDGFVSGVDDCDDLDPQVAPVANEGPNGQDDDCDGWTDEGLFAPGEVVINELMAGPVEPLNSSLGEFIELMNGSSYNLSPAAVCLTDGRGMGLCSRWVLNQEVAPGEPLLLVKSPESLSGEFENAAGLIGSHVRLPTGVGQLFLTDGTRELSHFIWHSAYLSMLPGVAIGLEKDFPLPDPGATDLANWQHATCLFEEENFGTPGAENATCEGDEK